ncbi:hypothetical protein CsatB_026908 [Cannabis sativa]
MSWCCSGGVMVRCGALPSLKKFEIVVNLRYEICLYETEKNCVKLKKFVCHHRVIITKFFYFSFKFSCFGL